VAKILVGVTGSIAAYKACELVRLLVKEGHEVVPLLTPSAERFVPRQTFVALARRGLADDPYPHLEQADLLVIAPCSANTLAKLAQGLADSLVTEAALAHRGPTLVAPAMNWRMWSHPATQQNAATLRERGVELVGPEAGELAEGEQGMGRMAEPGAIAARCAALLGGGTGSLSGLRVLVSAGGTREPIDSVRFLGNRSSGRMGVALAAEAHRRGAAVTLVAANLAVPAPGAVELVEAPTAAELAEAVLERGDADVVLMAAAVADYRPRLRLAGKRPKDAGVWSLELEPTLDVLGELGARRRGRQVLVGFAADEGETGLARARQKLASKRVDLIVFNDISQAGVGFNAADNEVVLISADSERRVERAPKQAIAAAVLDEVERLLGARQANDR
jgi:phosphopantothenoylcysteine decarboxylase/phosphopantothenate--cysteine ligase